jgi:23S rRNA pseudouridine955/2504/2580 synthase
MQAKPEVRLVEVGPDDAGQRIDNFLLKHLKGVPKSHVYRLLRTGQVRVDGGRIKATHRVAAGEKVRIPPVRQAEEGAPSRPPDSFLGRLAAAIVHEDDSVLALDKPAGIAVHGGSGVSFGVIEGLRALRPEARALELAHRLDRDTSGVLLVAKTRAALRHLHTELREGRVDKRYLALLAGRMKAGTRVEAALSKNRMASGERMARVDESEGKDSASVFNPQQRFSDATLCEVRIETGRMHQIRVHAAHLGHPVLGDDKYGDREANKLARSRGLKRMFLHAWRVQLAHPAGGVLSVTAPLPAELQAYLDRPEAPPA